MRHRQIAFFHSHCCPKERAARQGRPFNINYLLLFISKVCSEKQQSWSMQSGLQELDTDTDEHQTYARG